MAVVENVSRIDPCRLERLSEEVADRTAELAARASLLGARLHPKTAESLTELVRVMNCYYSNLIEGHNTRPREIECALAADYDDERRDLQLEARAHIRVQSEIDRLEATGQLIEPASKEFVCWLHREFYHDAAPAMLRVETANGGGLELVPGEYRTHEVVVGRHQPPSSRRLDDFMSYFEQKFALNRLKKASQLIAMAIAHHRLNLFTLLPTATVVLAV